MKLIEMVLEDYLKLVDSDSPAPGGGSASALCGAQGIGLIAMAAKLTIGKKRFAEYQSICNEIIEEADELVKLLMGQIDLDTEAFSRISNAYKLPKSTEKEKNDRKAVIMEATEYAILVPLKTMELGVKGIKLAEKLAGKYNPSCASDVGCGVLGLQSCVEGAYLNVKINVQSFDVEKGKPYLEQASVLAEYAERAAEHILSELKL